MHILLISNMYPSERNPSYGVFVKNFSDHVIRRGIICTESVIKGRQESFYHKIHAYFTFIVRTVLYLYKNDYDIIYVHYGLHSILPFLFFWSNKRKPLIVNMHGDDLFPKNKTSHILSALVKKILIRSSMLVVPSGYFKSVAQNKLNHKNIFISPSGGIDLSVFKCKPDLRANNPCVVIGYVSRLDPGKGWDTFLCALRLLKSEGISFTSIVANDGTQVQEFISLVNDYDLKTCVKYLGIQSQSALARTYNELDLLVFPSILPESLGLVGIEAMACGVPVIGSRLGGLMDYIIDNENGFFVNPGDAKNIKEKIISYLYLTNEKKKEMSEKAIQTSKRYNAEQIGDALINKISEIVFNHPLEKGGF